jgi:cell division protein FtsW (lipid II flippase)
LLVAIAAVWFDLLLRRGRLFWTLAVSNTLLLLAGATFSNNYVPWASIWIVVAIVEAFSPRPDEMASLQPESEPSLAMPTDTSGL